MSYYMTLWFSFNVVLIALAVLAVRWSRQPSDDFGRAVVALIAVGAAGVSTLTYLVTALWLHRFF